jgi:spoIIIJ-associated protein
MSTANAQRAQAWLTQLLELMGIPAQVELLGERLVLQGLPPQGEALFLQPLSGSGEEGITLDALQYLANTLLNLHRPATEQQSYEVDLRGYREQRWAALKEVALAAIEQVRATGEAYTWEGLSAAERRQVHTFLQDPAFADLETLSQGKEPLRYLVIRRVIR